MEKGEASRSEEGNGDRKRKGVCWRGMRRSTGSPTSGGVLIIFGSYNIRNRRNGGMESALRVMAQANMDLGIFQETKYMDRIYNQTRLVDRKSVSD